MTSTYWWEGAVQRDTERFLLVKTSAPLVERLCAAVRAEHPYDVPEILAVPVVHADAEYAAWLAECLGDGTR